MFDDDATEAAADAWLSAIWDRPKVAEFIADGDGCRLLVRFAPPIVVVVVLATVALFVVAFVLVPFCVALMYAGPGAPLRPRFECDPKEPPAIPPMPLEPRKE